MGAVSRAERYWYQLGQGHPVQVHPGRRQLARGVEGRGPLVAGAVGRARFRHRLRPGEGRVHCPMSQGRRRLGSLGRLPSAEIVPHAPVQPPDLIDAGNRRQAAGGARVGAGCAHAVRARSRGGKALGADVRNDHQQPRQRCVAGFSR